MKDSKVPEGEGPVLTMPRGHGVGSMGGSMGLTPFLEGEVRKDFELGDGELPTESSGKSSDTSAEPPLASPRLIPISESPINSGSSAIPQVI